MNMPSAIIVDDHPAVRFAMSMILQSEGFSILAETDNGTDAINLTKEHKPTLVLLDININKENGLEVIQRIIPKSTSSKIIVTTSCETEGIAVRCLQAGASGFYPKERDLALFPAFLKLIMSGFTCFPTLIGSFNLVPIERRGTSKFPGNNQLAELNSLTNREIMIMKLLASGMTNKGISTRLNISPKTVSTHRVRLMEKINAKSIIEVCYFAKKNNLL